MAGFKAAKPEQGFLKLGIYGKQGSGKSLTALMIAEYVAKLTKKRVKYVDTEHGTDWYAQTIPERRVHPEAFSFDALYSRSITEIAEGIYSLDQANTGCVVLDSVTHLWEAAKEAYSGKLTSIGSIPKYAWGPIKKPYKDLIQYLMNYPAHFIICGRLALDFEDDEDGESKQVGVKMKTEGETPYEPHILIRMEQKRNPEGGFFLQAVPEKDRSSILAGKVIQMTDEPGYVVETICKPLMKYLGGSQAKMASTSEAAKMDADKLSEQEVERLAMSEALLSDMLATVTLCKTKEQLKDLGKKITPELKAQMTNEHVANLRAAYLEQEKKLK